MLDSSSPLIDEARELINDHLKRSLQLQAPSLVLPPPVTPAIVDLTTTPGTPSSTDKVSMVLLAKELAKGIVSGLENSKESATKS